MPLVTVFKDILSKEPYFIELTAALDRIKTGRSRLLIEKIRKTLDHDEAASLKKQLPCVCFSGEFPERKDEKLKKHSKFLILDFDEVDMGETAAKLHECPFVCAYWVSPRGNGFKALVEIQDGSKHREHFEAIREDLFPEADKSGVNVSRICFESYDPELVTKPQHQVWTKIKKQKKASAQNVDADNDREKFDVVLKWLTNRNDAFVKGERNLYIFKLASGCCRFGIEQDTAAWFIQNEYQTDNDFTEKECSAAIASAYKSNHAEFGTAKLKQDKLVDAKGREIEIDTSIYDLEVKPKDVVFGGDVKEAAFEVFKKGYPRIAGIGVDDIDEHWKPRRGEINVLTGYGNMGKTGMKKWYQVMRALIHGDKFAIFTPEEHPVAYFYHDLAEIILGCQLTPDNQYPPTDEEFSAAYDFAAEHFFYIQPTDATPTPDYIKQRFLELIIKNKVTWCDIDPFNQLDNDYAKVGGRDDKYLEIVLSDFARFAKQNDVVFFIVAHPKNPTGKDGNGNYDCPDVFNLAGGSMWNNKMDNILVYHRPYGFTNPQDPVCEFHSKKIRNQKIIGRKGFSTFEYRFPKRRFFFHDIDPMADLAKGLLRSVLGESKPYKTEDGYIPF